MKKQNISLGLWALILICLFKPLFSQNQKTKIPIREDIEWLDVWMPNTNKHDLPRVLLIGNSITRGYSKEVENLLAGKAYVAYLATSKSLCDSGLLKEIKLVMSYYLFDIVHFNNGLHGSGYTESEYRDAFPNFIKTIKNYAPHAKLIWASITPVFTGEDKTTFDNLTERVKKRNQIAIEVLAEHKDIKIDDLFHLVESSPEYYAGTDGIHPNQSGYRAIAAQVAGIILDVLHHK
jgi:lysophospholipase L1-like esterase